MSHQLAPLDGPPPQLAPIGGEENIENNNNNNNNNESEQQPQPQHAPSADFSPRGEDAQTEPPTDQRPPRNTADLFGDSDTEQENPSGSAAAAGDGNPVKTNNALFGGVGGRDSNKANSDEEGREGDANYDVNNVQQQQDNNSAKSGDLEGGEANKPSQDEIDAEMKKIQDHQEGKDDDKNNNKKKDGDDKDHSEDDTNNEDNDDDMILDDFAAFSDNKAPVEIVVDRGRMDIMRPVLEVPHSSYRILYVDPNNRHDVVADHGYMAIKRVGWTRSQPNQYWIPSAMRNNNNNQNNLLKNNNNSQGDADAQSVGRATSRSQATTVQDTLKARQNQRVDKKAFQFGNNTGANTQSGLLSLAMPDGRAAPPRQDGSETPINQNSRGVSPGPGDDVQSNSMRSDTLRPGRGPTPPPMLTFDSIGGGGNGGNSNPPSPRHQQQEQQPVSALAYLSKAQERVGHVDPTCQRFFRPLGYLTREFVFFEDAMFEEDFFSLETILGQDGEKDEFDITEMAGVTRLQPTAVEPPDSELRTYDVPSHVLDALRKANSTDADPFVPPSSYKEYNALDDDDDEEALGKYMSAAMEMHEEKKKKAEAEQRRQEEEEKRKADEERRQQALAFKKQQEERERKEEEERKRRQAEIEREEAAAAAAAEEARRKAEEDAKDPEKRKKVLLKQLNRFKKDYASTHNGDKPSVSLMKADPEIGPVYKEYLELKKLLKKQAGGAGGGGSGSDSGEDEKQQQNKDVRSGAAAASISTPQEAHIVQAPPVHLQPVTEDFDGDDPNRTKTTATVDNRQLDKNEKKYYRKLVKQLKDWKKEFALLNGREATRVDMVTDHKVSDIIVDLRKQFGTDDVTISDDEDEMPTNLLARKKWCARRLNEWKQNFAATNGRQPSIKDIESDDKIRPIFDIYKKLKDQDDQDLAGGASTTSPGQTTPQANVGLSPQTKLAALDSGSAASPSPAAGTATASPQQQQQQQQDPLTLARRRKELLAELNRWRAAFLQLNGRKPGSKDVNADPHIKQVYREYMSIPKDVGAAEAASRRRDLAKQLTDWKSLFAMKHGRKPKASDIQEDSDMAGVFLEYNDLSQDNTNDKTEEGENDQQAGGSGGAVGGISGSIEDDMAAEERRAARKHELSNQLNNFKTHFVQRHGRKAKESDYMEDDEMRPVFEEFMQIKKQEDEEAAAEAQAAAAAQKEEEEKARHHEVVKKLNDWKQQYKMRHGKNPTKGDIEGDEEIRDTYHEFVTYTNRKKQEQEQREQQHSIQVHPQHQQQQPQSTDNNNNNDDDDAASPIRAHHVGGAGADDDNDDQQHETNTSSENIESRKKHLLHLLNTWKTQFKQQHGKGPTAKDIKADAEMASVYAEYNKLKNGGGTTQEEQEAASPSPTKQPDENNNNDDQPTAVTTVAPVPETSSSEQQQQDTVDENRKKLLLSQLNAWKKNFKQQHGKGPTAKHIKADPEMAAVYNEYMSLKKAGGGGGGAGGDDDEEQSPTKESASAATAATTHQEGEHQQQEQPDAAATPSVPEEQQQQEPEQEKPAEEIKPTATVEPESSQQRHQQQAEETTTTTEQQQPLSAEEQQTTVVSASPAEQQQDEQQHEETIEEKKKRLVGLLNNWKAEFKEKNGRAPGSSDIKEDASIYPTFLEYQTLKSGAPSPSKPAEQEQEQEQQQHQEEPTTATVTTEEQQQEKQNEPQQPAVDETAQQQEQQDEEAPEDKKKRLVGLLNSWKADFKERNGRAPGSSDIKEDPSIYPTFLEYQALKSGGAVASPSKPAEQEEQQQQQQQNQENEETTTKPEQQEQSSADTAAAAETTQQPEQQQEQQDDQEAPEDKKKRLVGLLNGWKAEFKEKNGRAPGSSDIKEDPTIYPTFLEYQALKSGGAASPSKPAEQEEQQQQNEQSAQEAESAAAAEEQAKKEQEEEEERVKQQQLQQQQEQEEKERLEKEEAERKRVEEEEEELAKKQAAEQEEAEAEAARKKAEQEQEQEAAAAAEAEKARLLAAEQEEKDRLEREEQEAARKKAEEEEAAAAEAERKRIEEEAAAAKKHAEEEEEAEKKRVEEEQEAARKKAEEEAEELARKQAESAAAAATVVDSTSSPSASPDATAALEARKKELAHQLNAFKKDFKEKNGRNPTADDINADPATAAAFKEYQELKSGKKPAEDSSQQQQQESAAAAPEPTATSTSQQQEESTAVAAAQPTASSSSMTPEELEARKKELAHKLNAFKKEFKEKNERNPTADDINADAEMKAIFDEYQLLKRGGGVAAATPATTETQQQQQQEQPTSSQSPAAAETNNDDHSSDPEARRKEIGRQLNAFKKDFKEKNGRAPTLEDINADPRVSVLYQEYTSSRQRPAEEEQSETNTNLNATATSSSTNDQQNQQQQPPSEATTTPAAAADTAENNSDEARKKELAHQLNAFKKDFKEKNGRNPTADDINADPATAAAFKEYQELKSGKKPTQQQQQQENDSGAAVGAPTTSENNNNNNETSATTASQQQEEPTGSSMTPEELEARKKELAHKLNAFKKDFKEKNERNPTADDINADPETAAAFKEYQELKARTAK